MIIIRTISLLVLTSFLVAAPAPAPDSTQGGSLLVERGAPWGGGLPPAWLMSGGSGNGAKTSKPSAAPQSGGGGGGGSGGSVGSDTETPTQTQTQSQADTGAQSPPPADASGSGGGGWGGGKGGSGGSIGSLAGGFGGPTVQSSALPPSGSSSGGGGSSGYMSIVSKWRSTMGMSALSQDGKLEANAMDTSTSSGGALKHKLNSGSMAQVMAPGNAGNFESVFVGGWFCERPSLPGLGSVCASMSKGWNHAGQTGHADILSSSKYKKIGCALASGIWTCDLA